MVMFLVLGLLRTKSFHWFLPHEKHSKKKVHPLNLNRKKILLYHCQKPAITLREGKPSLVKTKKIKICGDDVYYVESSSMTGGTPIRNIRVCLHRLTLVELITWIPYKTRWNNEIRCKAQSDTR
mmetsp:Transcript_281/g.671  ORF Transcript_281/g.671 Transcript_281/m.671 type:complete len:124 (-) Transcript_281:30-401(-)